MAASLSLGKECQRASCETTSQKLGRNGKAPTMTMLNGSSDHKISRHGLNIPSDMS